jgi:hypothetical protein
MLRPRGRLLILKGKAKGWLIRLIQIPSVRVFSLRLCFQRTAKSVELAGVPVVMAWYTITVHVYERTS